MRPAGDSFCVHNRLRLEPVRREEVEAVDHTKKLPNELLEIVFSFLKNSERRSLLGVNRQFRFVALDQKKRQIFHKLMPYDAYQVFEGVFKEYPRTRQLPYLRSFESLSTFTLVSERGIIDKVNACYLEAYRALVTVGNRYGLKTLEEKCKGQSQLGFLGQQVVKMAKEKSASTVSIEKKIEALVLLCLGRIDEIKALISNACEVNWMLLEASWYYASTEDFSQAFRLLRKIEGHLKYVCLTKIHNDVLLDAKTDMQLIDSAKKIVSAYNESQLNSSQIEESKNLYSFLWNVMEKLVQRKNYSLAATVTMMHPDYTMQALIIFKFCISTGERVHVLKEYLEALSKEQNVDNKRIIELHKHMFLVGMFIPGS